MSQIRYHIAQRGKRRGQIVECKAQGACPFEVFLEAESKEDRFGKNYHDSYYQANKERMKAQTFASKKRRIQEGINYLTDYFENHPCTDCGNDDLLVLELDHVEDNKVMDVSRMIALGLPLSKIQNEV